jgi:hypothetical protein
MSCFKVWQSNKDKELHLLCGEGPAAFDVLPIAIRRLGPWSGGQEGEVERLRLPLRILLAEQGFVLLHCQVSKLSLEAATGVHALHPANTHCPTCKGTGRVPMHHGLRDKACPKCGGRGWVKAPLGR